MNKKSSSLMISTALLLLQPGTWSAALPVQAAETAEAESAGTPQSLTKAGYKTRKILLSDLNKNKTMDLKLITSGYRISVPIPSRWSVKKARLVLKYTNSVNLRKENSQLAVRLNDVPLGQVGLDPKNPDGELALTIPLSRLLQGYNSLSFSVAQHYMDKCEQWDAPDLWTNLQFDRSFLELEYTDRPVPGKLPEAFNFLFDPKTLPSGDVNIVTDNTSPETITMSGVVASGIAKRFDYKKVLFTASPAIKPGQDNVIVGQKEFVEQLLRETGIFYEVTGPVVKIMPLPLKRGGELKPGWDAAHGLLIISGRTPAELKTAAIAAAEITFPFPGKGETIIKDAKLPKVQTYSGKGFIERGKQNTFKVLGLQTLTFRGISTFTEDLLLRIPNDYLIRPNKYVTLALNYVYSPGLKEDSSLSIAVNGTIAQVINLDNLKGDLLEKYRLDLPAYLFRPGENRITFIASLTPKSQACEMLMPDAYFLTVYDNSTLIFPKMPHLAELPKIELFVDTGSPFSRLSNGSDTEIFLAEPDYSEIAAAFNMIGYVSQRTGYPLFDLKINVGDLKPSDKEIIVFSKFDTLPANLVKLAPIKVRNSPADSLIPHLAWKKWNKEPFFSTTQQVSDMDTDSGLIMGLESPYKKGRSILIFNASSGENLLKLSQVVMDPETNGGIKGSLAAIDLRTEPAEKMVSTTIGAKYWTGENGKISYFTYFTYVHPMMYYGSLIVLILVLSLVIYLFLADFREKRLALAKDKPAHPHAV